MRIVVIAALVILALWIIIAGIINRRKISWLIIFVLIAPAGALSYFEYEYQEDQKEISANVVQAISGIDDSTLNCQRLMFAFVDVWASEKTVDNGKASAGIKYNSCSQILGFYRSDPKVNPTLDEVKAFQLLSAESVRIAGKTEKEDEIQCLGIRNIKLVVTGLGGTEQQATYAYNYYKQEVFVKDNELQKYNC
jgi:hypothetical protein